MTWVSSGKSGDPLVDPCYQCSFGQEKGYNAQVALDAKSQVIVMAAITQENPDQKHLFPTTEENTKEECHRQVGGHGGDEGCEDRGMGGHQVR